MWRESMILNFKFYWLGYIGSGIQGVMLPGCPETYEASIKQFEGRKGGSAFTDRHQKIHQFWQGDVVAIPTGAAHWLYNNGQDELVIIALLDSTNYANQLDPSYKVSKLETA
ncbi:putative rmlC-like cupin domain superfamily, rmlC-like jelly roll protein [Helianthus annuus]|nr:putative rmlC-like cupin domain superfamily, rmlC-like jelly roll protein [Helianthus annuus]